MTRFRRTPSSQALVASAVLLVLGLVAAELATHLYREGLRDQERERVLLATAEMRSRLESALNSTVFLAQGLAAYVVGVETPSEPQISRVLRALHGADPRIRNVGLAPDGVIRFVYPREGNEKALGLRFADNAEQWPSVRRAIERRSSVLAGPVNLVQGGTGIVSRTPVFRNDATLWGIISIVINLERLLADVGFSPQQNDNIHLWLFGDIATDGPAPLISGPPDPPGPGATRMTIKVPGGHWELFGQPLDGWGRSETGVLLLRIGLYLASAVLAGFTYLLIMSRARAGQLASELSVLNEALVRKNAELDRLSRRDPLTGVLNRRAFDEALNSLHGSCSRNGTPLSVLVIDVDHFKSVNDRYGHSVGDATLVEVSAAIQSEASRRNDVVARYGGEEFIVMTDGMTTGETLALAEKIRLAAAECRLQLPGEVASDETVTVSIGAICRVPTAPFSPSRLVEEADHALYRAKREGRNRVCLSPASSEIKA